MIRNYLLTAYKVFTRRKLFTAINLLCIVLTLMVLVVLTALLENAFYPSGVEGKSGRFLQIISMEMKGPNNDVWRSPLGYKLIDKYLRPMKSAEMVAAVSNTQTVSVYQDGRVSELQMRHADANYWKILDFKVLAGRVPSADDVAQGRFVTVLNASTAAKLFPDGPALARTISVSGQQFTVIGVVEDVIHINAYADLWAPVTTYPSSEYQRQLSGEFTALVMGKSAADLPAIQAEVASIAKTVEFDDPKQWNHITFWADSKLDMFARLVAGDDEHADSGSARLLSGVAILMLLFMLLPALNLINLNSGRIQERSAEIGVRKAFGATSTQLVGQLVLENVLLCLFGGLIALCGAEFVLRLLHETQLIPYLNVDINMAVFFYGLLITTIFGLVSGVVPAWRMSRLDPIHALKGHA